MANQALNAKREQAKYLTKRANHKISRLRSKNDVEVAGTRYDPRVAPKLIARYTERQLDAYIARTSMFNDRGTQFVPDAHRRPIPAGEWKDYKRAEQAHVNHMKIQYDRIKDIKLPGLPGRDGKPTPGHESIQQRRDRMRSDRRLAGNPSTHDPFSPTIRDSRGIPSREKLRALIRDEKLKNRKGWDHKELGRMIAEFSSMIGTIGDTPTADKVAALTPFQFRTLWNGTGFATAISMQYEQTQALLTDKDKPWHAQLIHDAFEDARRLVDWALTLKEPKQDPAPAKGRKKK